MKYSDAKWQWAVMYSEGDNRTIDKIIIIIIKPKTFTTINEVEYHKDCLLYESVFN